MGCGKVGRGDRWEKKAARIEKRLDKAIAKGKDKKVARLEKKLAKFGGKNGKGGGCGGGAGAGGGCGAGGCRPNANQAFQDQGASLFKPANEEETVPTPADSKAVGDTPPTPEVFAPEPAAAQ